MSIPTNGSGRVSVTDNELNEGGLVCRDSDGDRGRLFSIDWYLHPTNPTIEDGILIDCCDETGWENERSNGAVILRRSSETPLEGVFSCAKFEGSLVYVGIYYPSEFHYSQVFPLSEDVACTPAF